MRIFSSKGFTLVEIMIVIAILWILSASLFPAYAAYQQRWRDASRVSDIDTLSKALTLYYSEKENFPDPMLVTWCVNYAELQNYGASAIFDPVSTHNNGCTIPGQYAYGMSTTLTSSPDEYALLAIMEQAAGWNYANASGLSWFTGQLSQEAFYSGTTLTAKWAGPNYIRIP